MCIHILKKSGGGRFLIKTQTDPPPRDLWRSMLRKEDKESAASPAFDKMSRYNFENALIAGKSSLLIR